MQDPVIGMQMERRPERVRWHLHGLNTGFVFGLTRFGVTHLPAAWSYAIGHVGTGLAFRLMREATSALVRNFRLAFPEKDEREVRALALRTYRSYGKDTIDFLRGLEMDRPRLSRHIADASGFYDMLALGKGILVVSGHFGNWELGGVMLRTLYDFPLAVVSMPETDPAVTRVRESLRDSIGIESVEVRQAVDTALRIRKQLAQNRLVAILADRGLERDRVEVQFFGRPTPFLRTPALMGFLTGAPLLPAFMVRQEDDRFAAYTSDPIFVERTGNRDANVQRAMQRFASALEAEVRKYPHLWYHFYPYWS